MSDKFDVTAQRSRTNGNYVFQEATINGKRVICQSWYGLEVSCECHLQGDKLAKKMRKEGVSVQCSPEPSPQTIRKNIFSYLIENPQPGD